MSQIIDAPQPDTPATDDALPFQAEVSRLLDIVAHALYSEREVFLRELIANAADACDKRRYLVTMGEVPPPQLGEYQITLKIDKEKKCLEISDNGIGMNEGELVGHLGTIARSGTGEFLSRLSGDALQDSALIGQFGVGFYAAFMVAHKVEVVSRKAGEKGLWRWHSQGKGRFTVTALEEGEKTSPQALPDAAFSDGTTIRLFLKEDAAEFLEEARLKEIVRKYSDHIGVPVLLAGEKINSATALWLKAKQEVSEQEYHDFYRRQSFDISPPWLTLHWKGEGVVEYSALLFIPTQRPYDLFDPRRQHAVKLYVRRVFITQAIEGLLPPYLRFLRGVVECQDLPLNISREMLQADPRLAKVRQGLTKKIISELNKKAKDDETAYRQFWQSFGAVLKEGLYDEPERREDLLKLARFQAISSADSNSALEILSLEDYVARMKPGQSAIYYISGDNPSLLRQSPQLEGYLARDITVLLLTDPVDDFWPSAVGSYADKPLRSVTCGSEDLDAIAGLNKSAQESAAPSSSQAEEPLATAAISPAKLASLIAVMKTALGDAVKEVRASQRLASSAVCLVADAGDMDLRLEKMMKAYRQLDQNAALPTARILEINPEHALIRQLAHKVGTAGSAGELADAAWLLFDQARIMEGEMPKDMAGFAKRMSAMLARALP
jgi:molecular chaperone HtpG